MVPMGQFVPMMIDQGTYVGETNGSGERHGLGKCTWLDGTWYEGYWQNNMRHGEGEFSRVDGYWYKGQYNSDVKHGDGHEKDEAGNSSKVEFKNNVKNGRGIYKPVGGKEIQCVWFEDLRVPENSESFSVNKDRMLCENIMMVIFYSLFFGMIRVLTYFLSNEELYFWGIPVMVVSGMFMVILICCAVCSANMSRAVKFAENVIEPKEIRDIIGKLKKERPIETWSISCYHYESRGSGKKRRRVKVTTHTATKQFRYKEWQDKSPAETALDFVKHFHLNRVQFQTEFDYTS